jgi:hypothetical protein
MPAKTSGHNGESDAVPTVANEAPQIRCKFSSNSFSLTRQLFENQRFVLPDITIGSAREALSPVAARLRFDERHKPNLLGNIGPI